MNVIDYRTAVELKARLEYGANEHLSKRMSFEDYFSTRLVDENLDQLMPGAPAESTDKSGLFFNSARDSF